MDCLQCSEAAAGRWDGVLVQRAWDAGGHMGPSDPPWNTDQGVLNVRESLGEQNSKAQWKWRRPRAAEARSGLPLGGVDLSYP